MIQHSVIFSLKHEKGSTKEVLFLDAAKKLESISGVQHFKCLRQVSPKNKFDYGLTMEFSDQETYDRYSNDEKHTDFIQNFWMKDVADFLEIDYQPL